MNGFLVCTVTLTLLCSCALFVSALDDNSECRFVWNYSDEDLKNETIQEQFMWDVMYWEGNFAKHKVGLNEFSGLTYDGHGIEYASGVPAPGFLHYFSAPSKESIHLMMLARAIEGNKYALRFVCNDCNSTTAQLNHAIKLLTNKMNSYEKWTQDYPGFAGFLPWFNVTDTGCTPNYPQWMNQVPALDNGEWIWGLRAIAYVLKDIGQTALANRYQNYLDMLAKNVMMVFYQGDGLVRTVTLIHDTQVAPYPGNYYQNCSQGCGYLDDPYEGEMMTFFIDLYVDWTGMEDQREMLWIVKRPMLQRVEYQVFDPPTNITVQKGFWFSSHEQWKYLELPYVDSDINKRIFLNGERARTWNSFQNRYAGMFASVNDVTTAPNLYPAYLSAAGIPSIAFQEILSVTTVTPYSVFPLFLTGNRTVAFIWYATMLRGPSMQGIFGSTESCNTTGTAISPVLTWDSKITTLCSMLGGIVDISRKALQEDGKYNTFLARVNEFWTSKFGHTLNGEDLPFMLPSVSIPYPSTIGDFSTCQKSTSSSKNILNK